MASLSPLRITVIYRQPSADLGDFLHDLERLTSTSSGHHIITGDFNIDFLDDQASIDYKNILSPYAFQNVINIPTRISTSKSSCLDHILMSFSPHDIVKSGTIQCDLSDHLPTFVNISLADCLEKNEPYTKQYTDYTELMPLLVNEFENYSFNHEENIEYIYNQFLLKLQNSIKQCTKSYTVHCTSNKQYTKPWLSKSLLGRIKRKYKLHKMCKASPLNTKLLNKYKAFKNELNSDLKTAKYNYYEKALHNCSNTSQIWDLLHKSIGKFKSRTKKVPTNLISNSNPRITMTKEIEIVNELNHYFSTIGEKLAQKFHTNVEQTSEPVSTSQTVISFCFQSVTESDIVKTINSLNEKKSVGLDQISVKFLKQTRDTISKPLASIFNKSIVDKDVPSQLKHAKVIPLHKKGSVNICGNFRPISILPSFSKVFEKLVNNQILNFLEENNLISDYQYGFRKKCSTSDAVVDFKDNTLNAFNKGNCVLGIFIDFSKAFDTIDHNILLHKMKNLGFSHNVILWVQSYLQNRTQTTFINSIYSAPNKLNYGVPQGSVLGPTLFLIYINDLASKLTTLHPIFYADDTNLFFDSKNLNDHIDEINSDLLSLTKWCKTNKLTINFEKCSYIILKNPQNKFLFNHSNLLLNNKPIKFANQVTFLGVKIDPNLNWSRHISDLLSQLRPLGGLLY